MVHDYTSHSRSLQVQVGDRLLSLNGEELMELTSKDCEYSVILYVHNYCTCTLLSVHYMHMHVVHVHVHVQVT